MPVQPFVRGQTYTRQEIHDQLGGDLQSYLPHVQGEVVCGCFTRRLDPNAPDQVLVGEGPDVVKYARVFAAQGKVAEREVHGLLR